MDYLGLWAEERLFPGLRSGPGLETGLLDSRIGIPRRYSVAPPPHRCHIFPGLLVVPSAARLGFSDLFLSGVSAPQEKRGPVPLQLQHRRGREEKSEGDHVLHRGTVG